MVQIPFRSMHFFNDLPPAPIVGARLGSTAPTIATFVSDIEQYTFDASNDYIIGASEVIHWYDEGTDIEAHVHWNSNGSEVGDTYVNFQLKYSLLHVGAAAGAQQTITTGDTVIAGGTADRFGFMTPFTDLIDGSTLTIGDYIVFRFERIALTGGGADPAADPFVIAVGFHAEGDSTGSLTRYTK